MAIKKKPKATKPKKLTIKEKLEWVDRYIKDREQDVVNLFEKKRTQAEVNLQERCKELEYERREWMWKYKMLAYQLEKLLSKEQLDAAKNICFVEPVDYALEWIKICKAQSDTMKNRLTVKESWSNN